jgi:hypothetical protein
MTHPNPHERTVRKAALPEVMHLEDVALALDVSLHDAERLLRSGRLGAFVTIGDRPAVLRKEFIGSIERRADGPTGASDLLGPLPPSTNGQGPASGGGTDEA